jgi:hypothetical protein
MTPLPAEKSTLAANPAKKSRKAAPSVVYS